MAPLPCRALPGRIVEGTPCMGKAVVPFFEKPDCVGRKGVHKTGIVGCDKELRVMGALQKLACQGSKKALAKPLVGFFETQQGWQGWIVQQEQKGEKPQGPVRHVLCEEGCLKGPLMEAQDQAPVSGFFRLNGLNPGPSGKILQNVSQDHGMIALQEEDNVGKVCPVEVETCLRRHRAGFLQRPWKRRGAASPGYGSSRPRGAGTASDCPGRQWRAICQFHSVRLVSVRAHGIAPALPECQEKERVLLPRLAARKAFFCDIWPAMSVCVQHKLVDEFLPIIFVRNLEFYRTDLPQRAQSSKATMRIAGGLKVVFQAGGKKGKGVKERAFACTMLANDSRQLGEGPFFPGDAAEGDVMQHPFDSSMNSDSSPKSLV